MKKITLTAALLSLSIICAANNLPFSHDVSIKDAGMSGVSAPFKGDAFSAFVNPAGLASAGRQEAAVIYHGLLEDASFSAFSYSHPVYGAGTIAASFCYLRISEIEELGSNSLPTGYKYTDSMTLLSASYGFSPFSFLDAGLTLKFLNHNFYTLNASAYGADLGAVVKLPFDVSASFFAENLIKPVFDFEGAENSTLPVYFDAVVGWEKSLPDLFSSVIRAAAGISRQEYSNEFGWHTGAEISLPDTAALRAGISDTGFSAGLSASYGGVSFHYALQKKPADFLHRFSLTYTFGDDIRLLESKTRTQEEKVRYELINKVKTDALAGLSAEIDDYMYYGEYSNALTAIDKALAWDPDNAEMTAKKKQAEELLKGKGVSVLIADADALIKENRHIDALVKIKSALDIDPANAQLWERFRATQSAVQKSAEENIIAEAKNEKFIRTHFDKGLANYSEGKFEDAIKEWDKVIKASPLQRQVYSFIQSAQAKIAQKKDTELKSELDKKDKITTLYNKAALLHSKGNFEESINTWRQLLELDPANEEAKKILEKVTQEYKEMQLRKIVW